MKILLVDDHALFREGMRMVLQRLEDEPEIFEADNYPQAVTLAEQHPDLDVALLDLHLPGSDGAPSIRQFYLSFPHIPVVVVSGEDDRNVVERVMAMGASGYICKNASPQVVLSALNLVLSGGVYVPPQILRQPLFEENEEGEDYKTDKRKLRTNEYGMTTRQTQVLRHLAAGLSNREIARTMNLAEGTVKIHISSIFNLLGVNKRMDAVRTSEKLGLIGGGE